MLVLGIETSCDETAAALVTDTRIIRANQVLSQIEEHQAYGGVVPEIAARAHLDHLGTIITATMQKANASWKDLSAIAVTGGPGLIGGVIVGVMTAKALAASHNLPFIAVNHLEAHALTARLTDAVEFPYLLLLVSGGHTQILLAEAVGHYTKIGGTIDDAAGEAFDKVAKLLELGFPGGPALQIAAATGNVTRFALPRPLLGRPGCDFSFSGLKTAVRLIIEALPAPLTSQDKADVAASFQSTMAMIIADRCRRALKMLDRTHPSLTTLVVAGGVAANTAIRSALKEEAERAGLVLVAPPPPLCTDNAAMVAWAGIERLKLGLTDGWEFAPRPRWPLTEMKG